MCCLIVEILMLLAGLYAIVSGKLYVNNNLVIRGWRARVVGLFLVVPLPFVFFLGLVIGVLNGLGVLPESVLSTAPLVLDILAVLFGLSGAAIFVYVTR